MARIGEIQCCNPACGVTGVSVDRTAGGKLSAKCHKCKLERWAPVGTKGYRDLLAQTTLDDEEPAAGGDAPPTAPPTPDPAPTAKAPAAPARRGSANNPFNMGL